MCTVIVQVPDRSADAGGAVRMLAVRDEDPGRPWDPLGAWWPQHPQLVGVRDARAGGAWLAADAAAGRVAVVLNRADVPEAVLGAAPASRGHLVIDAVTGTPPADPPRTHGFNLVDASADGVHVRMWDGASLRRVRLASGVHMLAHDDVDDEATARIARWRDAFADVAARTAGDAGWAQAWLAQLASTAVTAPTDDAAVIRDNRPHGYPTLSLLVCTAEITASGAEVRYAELDDPGTWNAVVPE